MIILEILTVRESCRLRESRTRSHKTRTFVSPSSARGSLCTYASRVHNKFSLRESHRWSYGGNIAPRNLGNETLNICITIDFLIYCEFCNARASALCRHREAIGHTQYLNRWIDEHWDKTKHGEKKICDANVRGYDGKYPLHHDCRCGYIFNKTRARAIHKNEKYKSFLTQK